MKNKYFLSFISFSLAACSFDGREKLMERNDFSPLIKSFIDSRNGTMIWMPEKVNIEESKRLILPFSEKAEFLKLKIKEKLNIVKNNIKKMREEDQYTDVFWKFYLFTLDVYKSIDVDLDDYGSLYGLLEKEFGRSFCDSISSLEYNNELRKLLVGIKLDDNFYKENMEEKEKNAKMLLQLREKLSNGIKLLLEKNPSLNIEEVLTTCIEINSYEKNLKYISGCIKDYLDNSEKVILKFNKTLADYKLLHENQNMATSLIENLEILIEKFLKKIQISQNETYKGLKNEFKEFFTLLQMADNVSIPKFKKRQNSILNEVKKIEEEYPNYSIVIKLESLQSSIGYTYTYEFEDFLTRDLLLSFIKNISFIYNNLDQQLKEIELQLKLNSKIDDYESLIKKADHLRSTLDKKSDFVIELENHIKDLHETFSHRELYEQLSKKDSSYSEKITFKECNSGNISEIKLCHDIKEINNFIKPLYIQENVFKPYNLIGKGSEAEIYQLDNNYVIRSQFKRYSDVFGSGMFEHLNNLLKAKANSDKISEIKGLLLQHKIDILFPEVKSVFVLEEEEGYRFCSVMQKLNFLSLENKDFVDMHGDLFKQLFNKLKEMFFISHKDLQPKNIGWMEGKYCIFEPHEIDPTGLTSSYLLEK